MVWLVVLLLCLSYSPASAQESDAERLRKGPTPYDRIIIRFNTNIQRFASWEAFKATAFPLVPPGNSGACYVSSDPGNTPAPVSLDVFPQGNEAPWHETTEYGWRQHKHRTFVEYRVNKEAWVLLIAEGVKPRFFFAFTSRLCEFPLASNR